MQKVFACHNMSIKHFHSPHWWAKSTGVKWRIIIQLLHPYSQTSECLKYKIFNILFSIIYREYLEYTRMEIILDKKTDF